MAFKLVVFGLILVAIVVLAGRGYRAAVDAHKRAIGSKPPFPTAPILAEHLNRKEEGNMPNHVYKLVEIVGSSETGTDDAIRNALETAAKTIRHIDWFEVMETRGHVVGGKVAHFQVTLKIGFRLDA